MNIIESQPSFGNNYDAGYVAFISRRSDFIATGINWFTRWNDLPGEPPVSHTFLITGENQTVEAFSDGVHGGTLSFYVRDPDVAVLVRRPINFSADLGQRIVTAATEHIGEHYNFALIAAMAASNTIIGHAINQSCDDGLLRFLTRLANSDHREICSQLVGKCLQAQPELEHFGCLLRPSYEITPQMLFGDSAVFEPGAVELLP